MSVRQVSWEKVQDKFEEFPASALRAYLIVAAIVIVILALTVDNNWVLAAIAAYISLP